MIVLAFILLSQQAGAQSASSSYPSRNVIRGVVINSVTREPVGHALVVSGDNRLATMTDDEGRFEIAVPGAGDQKSSAAEGGASGTMFVRIAGAGPDMLFARKPGYLGSDRPQRMLQGVAIVPGRDVTIKLVPEGRIVGRVVLPNGSPLDQVRVELYRRVVLQGRPHWNRMSNVAVRASGEFRFVDLEAGRYKLFTGEIPERDPVATDPGGTDHGYPPVYFPNASDFQAAGTIQITPGTTFQAELVPVRHEYYPVKIPVAGASGTQVGVQVWPQGHKGPGFSLGFNPRQQRIEGALPNGTYVVEARSEGDAGASGSVNITVKGGEVSGPGLTLLPQGSVRVNVKTEWKQGEETEASREPGEAKFRAARDGGDYVQVWLENTDEFDQGFFRSDPSRRVPGEPIVFEGVKPGRYWVRVESAHGFAGTITLGEVDLLRKPLTVGPGANLAIDVTMRDDGAEVSGTVEDGDGHVLASSISPGSAGVGAKIVPASDGWIHIYCVPEGGGQFREMVTSDGKFDLQQIPPGIYRLVAFDRPQAGFEYGDSEAVSTNDGKGRVVRLAAGQKENVTLRIISTDE